VTAAPCALVTGASSGIGAAFARALHRRGEKLVLLARRVERLQALSRELDGAPVVIPADLSASGAVARVREQIEARGLDVALLVNNAGLGHTAAFEKQDPEVVRRMIAVNVSAVVELTHAFLPAMKARGRGRIINVASNAAFQPVPYLTVYAATKAFVLSFSEGLDEELRGSGVRVQALCPGTTATEFFEVSGTRRELLVSRLPMMSAEAVVAESLRGLESGRVRVVAGLQNRLLGFVVQRVAPRSLARRVAARLYRPPRA
jgi:short-subunit dehydrogenase